jgi:hypothetical protein
LTRKIETERDPQARKQLIMERSQAIEASKVEGSWNVLSMEMSITLCHVHIARELSKKLQRKAKMTKMNNK